MAELQLPVFLKEMIGSPPCAGSGVHAWLFKVARQLHRHFSSIEIADLLANAVKDCGRRVSNKEIHDAILNSGHCAWRPQRDKSVVLPMVFSPPWPKFNASAVESVIRSAQVGSMYDLAALTPVECDPPLLTIQILEALFDENPFLCVGKQASEFTTQRLGYLSDSVGGYSLIVPSAMSAKFGKVKGTERLSAHTLDNTGPRQFLVTEFDNGSVDSQASLIWHLSEFGPLVMVVHSGGKSLHAWWRCAGQADCQLKTFMKYAVSLGADPATWLRSQFVRMPEGLRDGTRPQRVIYFNPEAGLKWDEQ